MEVKRRLGFADGAGPDSPQTAPAGATTRARPCHARLDFRKARVRRLVPKVNLGPEAAGFKVLEAGIHEGDPKGGCQ